MCKFSSRLFVFLAIGSLLFLASEGRPATSRSLIDLLTNENDYDVRYDQRQKGVENVRIKLDGFFIGIPAEPSGLLFSTDELLSVLGEELLLGRHGDELDQLGDSKPTQEGAISTDLVQKGLEKYQGTESGRQEASPEERGGPSQGSRTKVYVMNLLDYIKRNRRS